MLPDDRSTSVKLPWIVGADEDRSTDVTKSPLLGSKILMVEVSICTKLSQTFSAENPVKLTDEHGATTVLQYSELNSAALKLGGAEEAEDPGC